MQHYFLYIEGHREEIKWEDYINCRTFVQNECEGNEEGIPRITGHKKYWIIFPKDSKYYVSDSSEVEDIFKQWDFEKHCCK